MKREEGAGAAGRPVPSPANRLGLNYRVEAARLGPPPAPILDVHVHLNGERALALYAEVAELFGVQRSYTQTPLADAERVRAMLGDRVRFVAVPDYASEDRSYAMREGFLENIRQFRERFGSCMVKLFASPRLRDLLSSDAERADVVALDSPWRVRAAELACELGMMFMTHVADPDTWFRTKYSDARVYGTKRAQYEPLERMLDRFDVPWIAAHMGGWPEDLAFLSGLLERHGNLYLDTSATRWMVRELSRHSQQELADFLRRWRGRVLFGSDIVVSEQHLQPSGAGSGASTADLAHSPSQAFDLYASRYWALRTLFEREYDGPSPIADPDLALVEPDRYGPDAAPRLRGHHLPAEELAWLYHKAAANLVEQWWATHG